MSLSPNNILHRLQELRLWQQNLEKSRNFENTKNSSDYRSIDGLSAFDSTTDQNSPTKLDWESKPVTPAKNFNKLLEEKLAEDPGPLTTETKPKKPFLKKGTGLERFRMKLDEPKRVTQIKTAKRKILPKKTEVTPLKVPDLAVKATWTTIADDNSADSVQKINKLVQLPSKPEASDQTLYERALERELLIFETLEQRVDNSSFCSTNSSIVKLLSSTPSKVIEKKKQHEAIIEEKHVNFEKQKENLERAPPSDLNQFLQRLQQFSQKSSAAAFPNISPIELSDEDKWSDLSLDSSISSTDLETTVTTVERRDVAVGTSDTSSLETELARKIDQYDQAIENSKLEQLRVAETKKKLQQQKEDFEKEMVTKRRKFEEEKIVLLNEIESERKRLSKEKLIFQNYMKDSQNRPNKKEREEIGNLKREVVDLTETLKLKESKNGMTQARLRNQIKQLEKDNSKLKEEIEKLTRENAKLTATQKLNRRPSESKILQEINKNVTELAKETRKSRKSEGEPPKTGKEKNFDEKETRKSGKNEDFEPRKSFGRVAEKDGRGSRKSEVETRKVAEDERFAVRTARGSLQNDEQDSLFEMATVNDLEREYRNVFGGNLQQNVTLNDSKKIDKTEEILEDGSRQIKYHNGNTKVISQDGNVTIMKYYNGDIKQTTLLDGVIKYFFYDTKIWQTTYPDGTELTEFPEGQKEKRYNDGKREIFFSDDIIQTIQPNGTQNIQYPDGSVLTIDNNDDKVLLLPNGQKEIRTKEHTRREFPDGTVKLLYPDGSQETRYANGRVRKKDATGVLIVDTQT